MPAAPSIEQLQEELAKLKEAHETQQKALQQQADLSGLKSAERQWEDTDESVNLVQNYEGRGPVAGRRPARASVKSICRRLTREVPGYKPFGEFKSLGDFLQFGVENRNSQSKIESRHGNHMEPMKKAIQGLNTQDGASGGFLLMPEFAPGIRQHEYDNNLWDSTDQYTVGPNSNGMTFIASAETSRATGSRAGGIQGYWLGEGATATKSKPTIREVNVKLQKMCVVVYFTDEMLKDAQAMQQHVERSAAAEFNFMGGDALINGTGVGQPLGWGNAPCLISVAKEVGQAAATLQPENIEKMYARFLASNLGNAKWYANQDVRPQLDLMILGLGLGAVPVYMPPGGLSASPYGLLKGLPLQHTEFNATIGTQLDILLADMGQMLTINKGGIEQAESIHVEFLTDQTAVRLTRRVGGRPWENSPITPYKGSNTQGSAITLDTRA